MLRLAVLATTATVASLLVLPPATAQAAAPTCFGKKATIVGTKQADRLVGTDRRDVIVGLGGDDRIQGGRGADLICGGGGADRLAGGPGDDRIHGGYGRMDFDRGGPYIVNDWISPGAGDDIVVPVFDNRAPSYERDRIDFSDSPRGLRVRIPRKQVTGHGVDTLRTTAVEIVGSRYDDVMEGGAGRDDFIGLGGADDLRGGSGNDRLKDELGYPSVSNDPTADRLTGGPGNDNILGQGGTDTISAGSGNDMVEDLGRSADKIDLGPGRDSLRDLWDWHGGSVITGGEGRDDLYVDLHFWKDGERLVTDTTMDLPAGITTVRAQASHRFRVTGVEWLPSWEGGNLTFVGTDAAEEVSVYDGRLVAHAFGGDDTLQGAERNDVLDGGAGTDTAIPRGGRDRCVSTEQYPEDRCEVSE